VSLSLGVPNSRLSGNCHSGGFGKPSQATPDPDGSRLWIGQRSLAYIALLDTKTATVAGSLNLGGSAAQSGDGYEPAGIVLTTTPTPGS